MLNTLRRTHGDTAVRSRPLTGAVDDLTVDEPADPLAGLRAACHIASLATALGSDYAADARGAGRSWHDIAAAVGLDADDPADAAFTVFARSANPYDDPVMCWRCGSCDALVVDRGPYNPHPDDRETGHAPGCPRHAGDVDAYRQTEQ